jgi:hypothetical protein
MPWCGSVRVLSLLARGSSWIVVVGRTTRGEKLAKGVVVASIGRLDTQ